MFFKLILENASGDRVDMTSTANQYMTSKIEGLSPPPGTISTSTYAGMDGSYLNNAFIEKRNVVISSYNKFKGNLKRTPIKPLATLGSEENGKMLKRSERSERSSNILRRKFSPCKYCLSHRNVR